jgi:uncharacterized OsmC-like protein
MPGSSPYCSLSGNGIAIAAIQSVCIANEYSACESLVQGYRSMSANSPSVRFELRFDAEGRNESGFRTYIVVHRRGKTVESFDLPCDEGKIVGGTGTAPWPLCYFASGLAGCLATHLRSFASQLDIPLDGFTINATCRWEARQSGALPYVATPISFTLDIDLGDRATEVEQRRLIAAASQGCFAEQSLRPGLVKHRLKILGNWTEL